METYISNPNFVINRNLEHQLEFVAEIDQVSYINDSKATSIHQTIHNIDSLDADIVLIIGGKDDKTDYTKLSNISVEKIKAVVYLGEDGEKLFQAFSKYPCLFVAAMDLEEALSISEELARPNQIVLFSPACPSYEAFDNYTNRGNLFKELVFKKQTNDSISLSSFKIKI